MTRSRTVDACTRPCGSCPWRADNDRYRYPNLAQYAADTYTSVILELQRANADAAADLIPRDRPKDPPQAAAVGTRRIVQQLNESWSRTYGAIAES